jgi:ring-1,2-phenylacetyl-CoA epoxidase subunit PaaD
MVTVEEVWEALAEIPDPEIPVISLVELGVVKDVTVDDGTVHVDFTPTFMGCPALDTMRLAMQEKIADLGAEPDSRGPREATQRRLRTSRPADGQQARARPAPAGLPLPVLRLDEHTAREPLRPDAVPLDPLLRRLSPAVRAVQDAVTRVFAA